MAYKIKGAHFCSAGRSFWNEFMPTSDGTFATLAAAKKYAKEFVELKPTIYKVNAKGKPVGKAVATIR